MEKYDGDDVIIKVITMVNLHLLGSGAPKTMVQCIHLVHWNCTGQSRCLDAHKWAGGAAVVGCGCDIMLHSDLLVARFAIVTLKNEPM